MKEDRESCSLSREQGQTLLNAALDVIRASNEVGTETLFIAVDKLESVLNDIDEEIPVEICIEHTLWDKMSQQIAEEQNAGNGGVTLSSIIWRALTKYYEDPNDRRLWES